jgi:RNA 2',3'-cyclic 3'-phosphodiesterase
MRETTRTFIAIPIPDPVGQQLVRWQKALTPHVPGCRWTMSESLPFHITLAFLGDVHNKDLNELCLAVAAAGEPFSRFDLKVEGFGAFPGPGRPRVVWAGITAPDLSPLIALREAVVRAATESGYRPDDPRFHPHVTLGRIKSERGQPCDLTRVVEREQARPGGSFSVVEVVTYASAFEAGGASYAPLNRARLKGKKTEALH